MASPIPIILLNGPPKCGKDTIAKALCRHINKERSARESMKHTKFVWPLKRALATLMDEDLKTQEKQKDEKFLPVGPMTQFTDTVSRRDLMIQLFEAFIKPVFGSDYWGKLLAMDIIRQCKWHNFKIAGFVVSDLGFIDEYEELLIQLEALAPTIAFNVVIVQIRRDETNFDNDSRDCVQPAGRTIHYIENNDTVEGVVAQLIHAVKL